MAKIPLEELENAGRIDSVRGQIGDDKIEIVKYNVPAGRSGKFYIRVFENGLECTKTNNALVKIMREKQFSHSVYSENANIFGNNLMLAIQQQKAENERLAKLEAERIEREKQAKIAAEKAEQERLATLEQEKLERERQIQLAKAKAEADEKAKIAREKIENSAAVENLLVKFDDVKTEFYKTDEQKIFEQNQAKKAQRNQIVRWVLYPIAALFLVVFVNYILPSLAAFLVLVFLGYLIYYIVKGRKNPSNLTKKLTTKVLGILTGILLIGTVGAGTISSHEQALAQARSALQKSEDNLNNTSMDHVSNLTKSAIVSELSDTKNIEKASNTKEMSAEAKRLDNLSNQANDETHEIDDLLDQSKTLQNDGATSSADKDLLSKMDAKANDYQYVTDYRKSAQDLYDLVSAHNARSVALDNANGILKDKDLSSADKSKIIADIKALNASSKADEINNLSSNLTDDVNTAKANIAKVQEAQKEAADKAAAAKQAAQEKATAESISTSKAQVSQSIEQSKAAESASMSQSIADSQAAESSSSIAASQAAAQSTTDSAPASSADDSGWTTAPAGQVFVSKSNKYYTSVVNPGNYSVMSIADAQAAGATAGHNNEYARN